MNTVNKYNIYMRIAHWLLAVLIIGALTVGFIMTDMDAANPLKRELYGMHKSFGVLILALVVIRFGIRLASKIPPYPKELNRRDILLSHAVVVLLYCLMFIMPISGYIMSTAGGYGVMFFGIPVPSLVSKDLVLSSFAQLLHNYAGYFFAAAIILHLLGTIKHYLVEKINLLNRL
jgi:cytochrome b561